MAGVAPETMLTLLAHVRDAHGGAAAYLAAGCATAEERRPTGATAAPREWCRLGGGGRMRADELKGRAVLALSNAEKIGRVEDVLFDAQLRRVLGFRVERAGLFGKAQALLRGSVTAVGGDALTVQTPDAINDEARFAELASASTLSQVQRTKVVTVGGELLGTVAHLEIDDDARTVTGYALASSLVDRVLRHDAESVSPDEVIRLGEGGTMVVPDAVATRLQTERG